MDKEIFFEYGFTFYEKKIAHLIKLKMIQCIHSLYFNAICNAFMLFYYVCMKNHECMQNQNEKAMLQSCGDT